MTLKEKIRNEVAKRYGREYGLNDNFRISLADSPPEPGDLKSGTVLQYLGRIRNRSIYLMRMDSVVLGISATLTDIPQMKGDMALFIPNTYETARKYVEDYLDSISNTAELFDGQNPGYLLLNRTWMDNPGSYEATFDNFQSGSLSSLIPNDTFVVASKNAPPILSGTTLWGVRNLDSSSCIIDGNNKKSPTAGGSDSSDVFSFRNIVLTPKIFHPQ